MFKYAHLSSAKVPAERQRRHKRIYIFSFTLQRYTKKMTLANKIAEKLAYVQK
jgi:hypothetical protein